MRKGEVMLASVVDVEALVSGRDKLQEKPTTRAKLRPITVQDTTSDIALTKYLASGNRLSVV